MPSASSSQPLPGISAFALFGTHAPVVLALVPLELLVPSPKLPVVSPPVPVPLAFPLPKPERSGGEEHAAMAQRPATVANDSEMERRLYEEPMRAPCRHRVLTATYIVKGSGMKRSPNTTRVNTATIARPRSSGALPVGG